MKALLLLGTLASGGAERQLCTLAAQMKRRGIDVSVATYAPGDFYLPLLQEAGVEHRPLPTAKGLLHWRRILTVRKALRRGQHDVVLAFDHNPCRYGELAAWPRRRWGLVVSERSAVPGSQRRRWSPTKRLHLLADYVTTNSHTNRLMLERAVPQLRGRIVTVYNSVDLLHFQPGCAAASPAAQIRLLVAGGYQAQKNMQGLAEAVAILRRRSPGTNISVDWYGAIRLPQDYDDARRHIVALGLEDRFRLNGESAKIADLYRQADAVVLPSFYEGLPNTICEGMACGRPILMSAVSDAGNLVKEGENGFLFDPASPQSIAEAMGKFAALSDAERKVMGCRSREMAETLFDADKIVQKYIEILTAAASRTRIDFDHWYPEVPQTAYATLNERGAIS